MAARLSLGFVVNRGISTQFLDFEA